MKILINFIQSIAVFFLISTNAFSITGGSVSFCHDPSVTGTGEDCHEAYLNAYAKMFPAKCGKWIVSGLNEDGRPSAKWRDCRIGTTSSEELDLGSIGVAEGCMVKLTLDCVEK